jgi:CRP/FNR family transcriptional regulator
MAGSFLGGLPSELVGRLLAVGDRTDYPAGSTIYRAGASPARCWWSVVWCACI